MIFNTLFSEKSNPFRVTSEPDEEFATFYEDFIIGHYENEASLVFMRMHSELKKQGIRRDCFNLEIDLHNDRGVDKSLCSATYHVKIDDGLSRSLREKVYSIFKRETELMPLTTDLATPFFDLIQYGCEDDREIVVVDTAAIGEEG